MEAMQSRGEVRVWVKDNLRLERGKLIYPKTPPYIALTKDEILTKYNAKLYQIWLDQMDERLSPTQKKQALNFLLGRL